MLQFVSVMILQIFLPCYYGNQITYCANQLTNEVYHINWLQCQPSSRKLLYAYMEHLKPPIRIQAGYFFAVGLPIFVKVKLIRSMMTFSLTFSFRFRPSTMPTAFLHYYSMYQSRKIKYKYYYIAIMKFYYFNYRLIIIINNMVTHFATRAYTVYYFLY